MWNTNYIWYLWFLYQNIHIIRMIHICQMMNKAQAMVNTLSDTKWWRKFKLCEYCVIPQIINKIPSIWKKIYQGEFKSIRNVNHSLNVNHSNNMNILIQKSSFGIWHQFITFSKFQYDSQKPPEPFQPKIWLVWNSSKERTEKYIRLTF
jgi:hypothetical protein